jgi:hypothetical protein
MRFLKEALEDLDIRYSKPLQPVMLPNSMSMPGLRPGLGPAHTDSRESLGNAGYWSGSPEITRAPMRSMRPGPDIRVG